MKLQYFLTGTIVYGVSSAINAVIPFLLIPFLTRHLTPEDFGVVGMFQALSAAVSVFIGFALSAAAARKFYDNDASSATLATFVGSCAYILFFNAVFITASVALFASPLSELLRLTSLWLFVSVFVAASDQIMQILLGQWQIRLRPGKYAAFQISRAFANFVLTIVLVITLTNGGEARLIAIGSTAALVFVGAIYFLRAERLIRFTPMRGDQIKEALAFGAPLVPHTAAALIISFADRVVLEGASGLRDVGLYIVAVQISAVFPMIFDAINKAYVPMLFKFLSEDDLRVKINLVRYTYIWFACLIIVALVTFVFAPTVVSIVVHESFDVAGRLVPWIILGHIFGGMYMMVTNYIFYSKRTWPLSAVSVFVALLHLIFLWLFIQRFGLIGATYAFASTMALRFLLTWIVSWQAHSMPWFDSRIWRLKQNNLDW